MPKPSIKDEKELLTLNIVHPEKEEIGKEILADAIVKIGAAAESLRASGLNEKAIVVLIQDMTRLPKKEIMTVLESLRQLKKAYCK